MKKNLLDFLQEHDLLKDIEKTAINSYGLTDNCDHAGFILSNGEMLDFRVDKSKTYSDSGDFLENIKFMLPHADIAKLFGIKSISHKEWKDLNEAMTFGEVSPQERKTFNLLAGYVNQFIKKTKAIRINNKVGDRVYFQIPTSQLEDITERQKQTIMKCLCEQADRKIWLTIDDNQPNTKSLIHDEGPLIPNSPKCKIKMREYLKLNII